MNWRILINSLRNTAVILGITGAAGFFVGSKVGPDILGAIALGGLVAGFYFLETLFRETRLQKGWYL